MVSHIYGAEARSVYSEPWFIHQKNSVMYLIFFKFETDAAILLWKLIDSKEPEQTPVFQEEEDAQLNKESWSVVKTLR